MLPQRGAWFGAETLAAGLVLGAVAVLSLILVVNPPLAHWLTIEDGVVEWLQVSLDAAAVALIGRHLVRDNAEGERSPLDVLTVAALIGLIIGELDVDRWLFGTKVISTAFFFKAKYALPWRLLAALVVVGVPAAVGIYALRHVRTLWREGWSALGQPWGRVLAASAAPARPSPVINGVNGSTTEMTDTRLAPPITAVHTAGQRVPAASRRACRRPSAAATNSASSPHITTAISAPPVTPRAVAGIARGSDSSASTGEPARPASGAASVA